MNSKILFIYKFNKLFEILNEIKENLNFEIRFISDKDYNSSIFANLDNYLILSIDNKYYYCVISNMKN